MAANGEAFICCTEGAVPMTEVFARLYRQDIDLARSPRIAEARALFGLSEDVYARRYCALYGFADRVMVTVSATSANAVTNAVMS